MTLETRERASRRRLLQLSAAGITVGGAGAGWLQAMADKPALKTKKRRSCILLWMTGGPSQIDTFDPKPGHRNFGPLKSIPTAAPGVEFSENLPELAKLSKNLAVIRSMTSKEGDHGRATYFNRTGNLPQGSMQFPTFGSIVSKELESAEFELPSFVSVAPSRFFNAEAYGPGFLGSKHAPLVVGELAPGAPADRVNLAVENLTPYDGVSPARFRERLEWRNALDESFLTGRSSPPVQSHQLAYDRAVRLMNSAAIKAFDLEQETASVRDAYGRNYFGQGCLLARRLVEEGVPFIEVSLGSITGAGAGWDTHQDNFAQVKVLAETVDRAWARLMRDLADRGLLETTTIVWMGEFGRTPMLNRTGGRDHFPLCWSAVLAGGGIRGGQAVGKTSPDGMQVADRPIQVVDLLATICKAVGVDPGKSNWAPGDRPIKLVDPKAKPIMEILA